MTRRHRTAQRIGAAATRKTLAVVAILCLACSGGAANAAETATYPNQAVKIIVSFPAGTTVDALARIVSDKLGPALGQPVMVENRPGVSGNIGNDFAAKAAPDGYTLVVVSTTLVTLPATYGAHAVDPVNAFAPITKLAAEPVIILAHPALHIESLPQLVAEARRHPGELTYSTTGIGTPPHLAAAMFSYVAGIKLLQVPYGSSATLMRDLLSGEVPLSFGYPTGKEPFLRSGQLKPLAVTGARRLASLPNVPTVAELGYPGFDVTAWFGIVAPAATPRTVVDRLNIEIRRILTLPDVREALAAQGIEPVASTPEEFAEDIKSDLARWTPVVRALGLRLQ